MELSGEALIEAMVVGLEIHRRTAAMKMTLHRGILLGSGTPGPAAGAGKLLGLDAGQMRSAMGLAISAPLVTAVNYGTDAHFFESALQSLQAVIAADLAKAGCTGNADIERYVSTLFGEFDAAQITAGLGQEWRLLDFYFKKYPASFGVHRAVDVAFDLLREHDLSYDDIVRVEIFENGPWGTEAHPKAPMDWPEPRNVQEAQVSIQYCVGAAIRDGDLGMEQFDEEAVQSARYKEACAKTHFLPTRIDFDDYKIFSGPQRVVFETTDGRKVEGERLYPTGSPEDPLPPGGIADLFRKYTKHVLTGPQIEETIDAFARLEQLDSQAVGELLKVLGTAKGTT
jgi:2-methylcitrate dehydratase PrpD